MEIKMGKLIRLNQGEVDAVREFADMMTDGKVTHGMACFRTVDGDVQFCIINPNHLSYIIGLMERTKMYLIDLATEYVEDEE
jgi:hypothetical protein